MMLNLLSRPDPRDWSALPPSGEDFELPRRSLAGLKVAFSPTLGYARVMPEIAQIVELAIRQLEDLGATVELVETPFPDPTPAAMTMFAAGIVHSQRHLDDAAMAMLDPDRSEEHTSELQSLMRISYAVFCLQTKK